MSTPWKPEIEKKYRLGGTDQATGIASAAARHGLASDTYVFQRDWIPDFPGGRMREKGIVLRVRSLEYLQGNGPSWYITLKIRNEADGVHRNQELEISSDDRTNASAIVAYMKEQFDIDVDLDRLANVDVDYAKEIGLTDARMYIEKRRREFHDPDHSISVAIDELPDPAGWFAEIEVKHESAFAEWEQALGLTTAQVESRDYGQIVKDLAEPDAVNPRRSLSF